ncbi:MAG: signal peptidase II [Aquificaceae bacterium]|nr:signal peptidase II [Aquificaceae bacterium]MDW8236829.1 signal peptidase II [Aquificaceae bacterium]
MGRGSIGYILVYFSSASFVLFIDLLTKKIAEATLKEQDLTLLPFLHLVLVYNKGVAFGLFADAPDFLRLPLLLLTPPLAVLITLFYVIKLKRVYPSLLLGAIAGGALGNFYDRLFLGQVRDFIYLSYGGFSWPAFNLADASISIAVVGLLIREFFSKER